MTGRRIAVRVIIVLVAILLQVVAVNRLPLPLGHPDLLVMCVIAMGIVGGSETGALTGFFGGLALDLMPPAGHLAGQAAFSYTLVGYAAGLLADVELTSVLATILTVAVGSAGVVLAYAGLGALIGDAGVTPLTTVDALVAVVVYDVVLAPFVIPVVSGVMRRLEPAGPR